MTVSQMVSAVGRQTGAKFRSGAAIPPPVQAGGLKAPFPYDSARSRPSRAGTAAPTGPGVVTPRKACGLGDDDGRHSGGVLRRQQVRAGNAGALAATVFLV